MKTLQKFVVLAGIALMSLQGYAQIPTSKTAIQRKTTTTVDLSKINQRSAPKINTTAIKEYFKNLKVGTPNSKEGELGLTVVNNDMQGVITTTNSKANPISNSREICQKELVKVNVQAREFNVFEQGSVPSWLKPGVLMKAANFINGSYTYEQSEDRYPITLSTDLRGAGNPVFEIQHPQKNSELTTGISTLINQNASPVPANMSFYFNEVHSLDELAIHLTGKVSAGFGAISAATDLNYSTKKEFHYYYVEFHQSMFSIEVDGLDPNKVFLDASLPVKDYIYLSKVNYGRKALIIFKSQKSLEELQSNSQAKVSLGVTGASAKAAYHSLVNNSEVEVSAFFYGGTAESAASAIEKTLENGVPDIATYISGRPFDHTKALPISYELMNLNNEQLGLETNFTQIVQTCIPKVDYKLKVSLKDIQCVDGRDGGGNPDDYGLQQYIVYTVGGTERVHTSRDDNFLPNAMGKCSQASNIRNPLICGDDNGQIHVRENKKIADRNPGQINNSVVFTIPYDDYAAPNTSFKIYTWVKEYSSNALGNNDDKVLANNVARTINIKDVIDVLANKKAFIANADLPDKAIDTRINAKPAKFHNFGNGVFLADLENVPDHRTLEGPIMVGSPGQKAAVWVSFELIPN